MHQAYLLLGSNMSDRREQLSTAAKFISQRTGELIMASSCYETAPWGISGQPDFLNQVLLVKSFFDAHELMQILLEIEEEMGRIRGEKNGPRIIDIDILFFDKQIIKTQTLTVPHPFLHKRRFTLAPLAEIAPYFIHPVLRKSIASLLENSDDDLEVKKVSFPV